MVIDSISSIDTIGSIGGFLSFRRNPSDLRVEHAKVALHPCFCNRDLIFEKFCTNQTTAKTSTMHLNMMTKYGILSTFLVRTRATKKIGNKANIAATSMYSLGFPSAAPLFLLRKYWVAKSA